MEIFIRWLISMLNPNPKRGLEFILRPRKETYLIEPIAWSNIWVYGMDIYLAGWITREEFRRRASLIQEGSHVFQYSQRAQKIWLCRSGFKTDERIVRACARVEANYLGGSHE